MHSHAEEWERWLRRCCRSELARERSPPHIREQARYGDAIPPTAVPHRHKAGRAADNASALSADLVCGEVEVDNRKRSFLPGASVGPDVT
ncbi:hypothetical protein D9M69_483820 [compost metagenome]